MHWALPCVFAMVSACGFSGNASPGPGARDAAIVDVQSGDIAIDDAAADARLDAAGCPATYTLQFGGHFYRPLASNMYDNLVAACHNDGQYVIAINSGAENHWALGQLTSPNNFVWIGLHFTAAVWTWDDGTLLGVGFESFLGLPPVAPADPCADANLVDESWDTFNCNAPHPTLCECNGL